MSTPTAFRFRSKHVLLTYSQCGDLNAWRVNDHLGSLGAECIIGREDHVDGGIHLHAFAMWERQFETRNVRLFDVDGCHPNISPIRRTPEAAYDYAIKDGDVVAGGLERPSRDSLASAGSKWAEIIAATTRDQFFERVAELDPRALCTSFTSIRTYAEWKYRPNLAEYESPGGISFDTSRSPALNEWVGCNLGRDFVGKPAILHLRPRLGSRPGFHPETAGATRSPRAGALVRCSVSEVGLLT